MKNISALIIVVGVFLCKVAMGQELGSDFQPNFRNWLPCGDANVPVPDKPSFNKGDVDIYVSAFGDLVINLKKDNKFYCSKVGFGWKAEGFVYGVSQETKEELLLFKISGGDTEKYIDVYKNKFLFRVSDDRKDLIVSEKPKEESGNKIELVKHWSGGNSKINQEFYFRIMSQGEWEKVWRRHSDAPVPGIDFNKNMIIALFLGQTINISGIKASDVREINDVLRFRFDDEGFQTGQYGVLTTPYGIFVLSKNNKVVTLEQNIQNMIGGPPIWEAVGDLATGDNVIEGPKREILTEEEHRKAMDKQWDGIEEMVEQDQEWIENMKTRGDNK